MGDPEPKPKVWRGKRALGGLSACVGVADKSQNKETEKLTTSGNVRSSALSF